MTLRTVLIDGDITFTGYDRILSSELFKDILSEFLNVLESRGDPMIRIADVFKDGNDYDLDEMLNIFTVLTVRHLDEIKGPVGNFLRNNSELFVNFVESFYNFWRSKHRFMLRMRRFHSSAFKRVSEEYSLAENGTKFENLVRELYRSILRSATFERLKVLRQLPSGVQAMFLADLVESVPKWLRDVPFVWSVILNPPVIFYTRSNKRKGVFPLKERNGFLENLRLSGTWLAFPIHVGRYTFVVVVERDRLCHAAGLVNLFEIAGFEALKEGIDGYVVFGYPANLLEEDERLGVVFVDGDNYIGVVSDDPETDYFGYMKKIILTVHNLRVIDEGRLPVHGALALIRFGDGSQYSVMFVGDSGAGKSETLEALSRMEGISSVETIIDDMGSLSFENGEIVAYGTEVGAFVRLDDLPRGYAYSTMDRSIFMNPDRQNARVIVPFGNYNRIIKPVKVDLFLYANNYEVADEENRIVLFESVEKAIEVFSQGRRMAKGTTQEKGLTSSYFANPFGAVQRRERHEEIAREFLEKMYMSGVKVGEIRTMLGIEGYERKGPELAARALLDFLRGDTTES